jgi:hypothetical protein
MLDGKSVPLRITVHQQKAYIELLEKTQGEAAERRGDVIAVVKSIGIDSLAIAEIALNPIEGVLEYPKDRIAKSFDLDQISILAAEWLERKVFNPRAVRPADPLLPVAPVPGK